MNFPEVPSLALIEERLPLIFPEGIEHRSYLVRDVAIKTIYVMFYAGAIEGSERWIRPNQVINMTDEQSELIDVESRKEWVKAMLSNRRKQPINPWYADNSRESVRDETLRIGLIPLQAVVQRKGIPTTSSKPTYALQKEFSELFSSSLTGIKLEKAIENWQKSFLSKAAISRLKLMKGYESTDSDTVQVVFPDGAIRTLEPGPSSMISKAVIEEFAPRFLKKPKVLWLSESGNKVVAQDESLAKALGLKIDPSRALPDIILIDLGDDSSGLEMLVVFTEVVASDGPINRHRKDVLTSLATEAGFDPENLAFLTAFQDRGLQPFKKAISQLAWGSYAWFSTEPDHLIDLRDQGKLVKLSTLSKPSN